jgi:CD9 antigen
VAIGLWILIDPNSVQNQHVSHSFDQWLQNSAALGFQTTAAYILIAIGAVVMAIGFLGCCGALRESQCMLTLFFVLLSLIFTVLLATGVYAVLSKDHLRDYIQSRLEQAVHRYNNDTNSKLLMDFIQIHFKCCGASEEGVRDYGTQIPESCGNHIAPCPENVYMELTPNLVVIAGVGVGVSVVLLLGMIFSITLCCVIRSASRI